LLSHENRHPHMCQALCYLLNWCACFTYAEEKTEDAKGTHPIHKGSRRLGNS
jgi:hypothetical protein